jgi:hypothetical protein
MKIYKMKNVCTILALALIGLVISNKTFAQVQTDNRNGEVYVTNNYDDDSSNSIYIKWFADKVYYPDGFAIYRSTGDSEQWVKITAQNLQPHKEVRPSLMEKDKDLAPLLRIVNETPYAEFQSGIQKVFIALKALNSNDFAGTIGIFFKDENTEKNVTYKYKVIGYAGETEELINISEPITSGSYLKIDPPQDIRFTRVKGVVQINWKPEEKRYYGVNIYRESPNKAWHKITKQPRAVQQMTDQHGEVSYPDIFYSDTSMPDSVSLGYIVSAVDYFGRESTYSDEITVAAQDFDGPPRPTNLKATINILKPELTWEYTNVKDHLGFNVYRRQRLADNYEKVNDELVDKQLLTYTDDLPAPGNYYYKVTAVDQAGNESSSGLIFMEVRDITPPKVPENLTVLADTGTVNLQWAANTETDLKGYFIYRALYREDVQNPEYSVMNNEALTTTSYVDLLASNVRNKFIYAVAAEDTSYNRSALSKTVVSQLPDVHAPQTPFIKTILVHDDQSLSIEWLSNHEPDLKGYHIMRADMNNSGKFERVNTNIYPPNIIRYTDQTVVAGTNYQYYIVAEDHQGNLSKPSNIYNTITRNNQNRHVKSIDNVKLNYNKKKNQVNVAWSSDTDYKGYIIYRGTSNQHLLPVTGLMSEDRFTDKDLEIGKTYWYQVRAYGAKGDMSLSETLNQTIE